MADFDYHGADYGAEDPSRFLDAVRGFGLANWAGALTSLGLVAGLGVWAVDLTFRDVSTVPVIMALEGPMRIEPKDPGGAVAPYQGLALADITSGGSASASPDQIVLAPAPVILDAPAQADRIAALAAAAEATVEIEAPALLSDPVLLADDETLVGEEEDMLASAEAVIGGETSEAVEAAEVDPFRAAIDAAIGDAVAFGTSPDVEGPGIVESVRPRPRPANLRRLAATTPIEAPAFAGGIEVASAGEALRIVSDASPSTVREVDYASLAVGSRVVQLGAFDSAAAARVEWDRLDGRFGAYLAGKARLVEKASAGGREFWRLRAVGFADGADARRFCAELLANDAACIPVTVR